MFSNREISRLFGVFAELLLLHKKDERLAVLLSGAAYRIKMPCHKKIREWLKTRVTVSDYGG